MMSQTAPQVVAPASARVSIVRLHGEACFYCGVVHGALHPAGSITAPVEGGFREWAIVACGRHRTQRRQG